MADEAGTQDRAQPVHHAERDWAWMCRIADRVVGVIGVSPDGLDGLCIRLFRIRSGMATHERAAKADRMCLPPCPPRGPPPDRRGAAGWCPAGFCHPWVAMVFSSRDGGACDEKCSSCRVRSEPRRVTQSEQGARMAVAAAQAAPSLVDAVGRQCLGGRGRWVTFPGHA